MESEVFHIGIFRLPTQVQGLFIVLLAAFLVSCNSGDRQKAVKKITIPLGGNAYQTNSQSPEQVSREGIQEWHNPKSVYSAFVKFDKTKKIKVFLRAKAEEKSEVSVRVGEQRQNVEIADDNYQLISAGQFTAADSGYTRIDLKGGEKTGQNFASITDIVLEVPQKSSATYIANNEQNKFYWGRRGPSVHLRYQPSTDKDIEWFYSEVTVPEGQDPIGSYFMANGFGEGYFGMQVNDNDERRVLFSVWSPYKTDNPEDIPPSQRIQLLDKGKDVHAGKFGNEGSGGQSYWVFPWKAGRTYKFLNQVRPDGDGSTVYTAYFYAPERDEWKLIARFSRPKTDTWMTNMYSFLENFSDNQGYLERKAYYGNQWVRDKNGNWTEVNKVVFTGDNLANSGRRVDFSGGLQGQQFYLRNGGYRTGDLSLGSDLVRNKTNEQPTISFTTLP